MAAVALLWILGHVAIDIGDVVGVEGVFHQFAGTGEKVIVEAHNVGVAAVVVAQTNGLQPLCSHVADNTAQNLPVAASEAVNALFDVAHEHTAVALR